MAFPKTRELSTNQTAVNPFSIWRRVYKTNSTTDGVLSLGLPRADLPENTTGETGIHILPAGKELMVQPYGAGADGSDFRMTIELIHPMYDSLSTIKTSEEVAYISTPAAIVDCVLDSAILSAAVGPLAITDYFCNLITVAPNTTQAGVTRITEDWITDEADIPLILPQSLTIQTYGAKYVRFQTSIGGAGAGTPVTNANALFMVI